MGTQLLGLFCCLEAAHMEAQLGASCWAAHWAENQIIRWARGSGAGRVLCAMRAHAGRQPVSSGQLGLWRPLRARSNTSLSRRT